MTTFFKKISGRWRRTQRLAPIGAAVAAAMKKPTNADECRQKPTLKKFRVGLPAGTAVKAGPISCYTGATSE